MVERAAFNPYRSGFDSLRSLQWWCHFCEQTWPLYDERGYKVFRGNCPHCGHAICAGCGVVTEDDDE